MRRQLISYQFILVLISFMFCIPVWAFNDAPTLQATDKVIQLLKEQKTFQEKARLFEQFKSFVNNRLNTVELPENILEVDDEDPQLAEFAQLNEFETYIDMINIKEVMNNECLKSAGRIRHASVSAHEEIQDQSDNFEAQKASDIAKAFCGID